MKAFLENFGSILGAATLALLLMSVSHEYGYFWAVGRFFQTFLTTSDYFSNAVLWLPVTLVLLYLTTNWKGLTEWRFAPIGFNSQKALGNSALLASLIILPVSAFFFEAFTAPYAYFALYVYLFPLTFLWMRYGPRMLPFAETTLETQTQNMLLIAPVVIITLFAWGFANGQGDLIRFNEPYTLEMKKGENLHRIVLRAFDKGILVRDAIEGRIEFVKWDDITKISRLAVIQPSEPLSCSWFRINCPDFPTP
jgi:hypothetical protein